MAKVYEYIPSAYKIGATAAVIPSREEASVTRTSDGYSEKADGTLELKGANETRYYYDNGVRKILIEPQATNIIEDTYFQTGWSTVDSLTTINASLSPSNDNDAVLLEFTGGANSRIFEAIGVNSQHVFSVYLKKHEDDVDGTFPLIVFDTNYRTTLVTLTNEWQRFTLPYDSSHLFFGFRDDGNSTLTRAYAWGVQLEEGTKATSYIPNTFSNGTSTRTADTLNDNTSLTLSRTSQAYRTNKDGVLELMDANVPRIDYSDDLNCPSLLLEPQATNILTFWNLSNIGVTGFSSPDKDDSSATLIDITGGNNGRKIITIGNETSNGLTYTFSVYLKKHENDADGTFPLATLRGNTYHQTLVNLTDEWQRFSIPVVDGLDSYVGFNNTGFIADLERAYVWGPQLELGATPTSYIPNSFSNGTSTRTADTNVQTGDISQYLNQSEGVLEVEFKYEQEWVYYTGVFLGEDTFNFQRVVGFIFYPTGVRVRIEDSQEKTTTPLVFNSTSIGDSVNLKMYFNKVTREYKCKLNGVEVHTGQRANNIDLDLRKIYCKWLTPMIDPIKSIKIYDSINDY